MPYLVSIHYFPCIEWWTKAIQEGSAIEQFENYSKGSYRNRSHIIGPNGIQRLSIPLKKGKNQQTPITEVEIASTENWQKVHWQSIQSAYGNAPFFEFYSEIIKESLYYQTNYLFDFNKNIINNISECLGIQNELNYTQQFDKNPSIIDNRNAISPKNNVNNKDFKPPYYVQVFKEKHGFLANMSILDLLFCTGPQSLYHIEESFRQSDNRL